MEKDMRRILIVLTAVIVISTGMLFAHGGGGMGGGMSGSMMGGSGMMVVADDGSLLLSDMNMDGGMMGGGNGDFQRGLVNVGSDGAERWTATFDDGWPMMPVTDGDLVIVVLVNDWFMGGGGMGDGDWDGGDHGGGGHGGGGGGGGGGNDHDDEVTIVGLNLATGQEVWRTTVSSDMASGVQFSPDGSQLYVTIREMGDMGGPMGGDPLHQGDATGSGGMTSTAVIALSRTGTELWTYELQSDDTGPIANGGF